MVSQTSKSMAILRKRIGEAVVASVADEVADRNRRYLRNEFHSASLDAFTGLSIKARRSG